MKSKFIFEGLFRIIMMKSRRDAISLILLGITSFLCLRHCIADAGFSAVILALIANGYFSHKQKMALLNQEGQPTAPPPTVMQTVVDVAKGML